MEQLLVVDLSERRERRWEVLGLIKLMDDEGEKVNRRRFLLDKSSSVLMNESMVTNFEDSSS